MRKLRFHEQKLLKKTNFLDYKRERGHRDATVTYSGICLMVQKLVNTIKQMDPRDPYRSEMIDMLLDKLMRKLRFHEQKLLKKTNFLDYKRERGHRDATVTQRYLLVERDDYKMYLMN
ncbi:hypothetical protein E2562_002408 [Oryza meyeriana var. granulata]|uniref:Small ribosomal subunit protein uS4 N-terminal domain-containing protein n=1 Tax=Oryza meyeriana var. granulata TaxID=110450 RepID=A0A6G1BI85_9ORYZ|nr:hypothetical protein E2562_002408 [Oryza meyeriana var. granulata]